MKMKVKYMYMRRELVKNMDEYGIQNKQINKTENRRMHIVFGSLSIVYRLKWFSCVMRLIASPR